MTIIIENFTEILKKRLDSYEIKYRNRPIFAAYKVAAFSLRAILVFSWISIIYRNKKAPVKNKNIKIHSDNSFKVIYNNDKNKKIFTINPPITGHRTYDIPDFISRHPEISCIEFVFFMGIGDYIIASNFFEYFQASFPKLKFKALVSSNIDGNNSPKVRDLLIENHIFKDVDFFEGKPAKYWKQYDYSDALEKAEDNSLLLPVIYQHDAEPKSRVRSLCETFGIKTPNIIDSPKMPLKKHSDCVIEFTRSLKSNLIEKKIVYLQLDGRSSGYKYPHSQKLIRGLIEIGFIVITADEIVLEDKQFIRIDANIFSISDSIKILNEIKKINSKFFGISISSVGSAITAFLDIPSVVIQQKYDEAIHSVYFSNHWILTSHRYPNVPDDRQFIIYQKPRENIFEKTKYYDFNEIDIINSLNTIVEKYS